MKLQNYLSKDGTKLTGLFSEESEDLAVVYLHGFGGDFYSSPLVQSLHRSVLGTGVSFFSIGTRVTHYLTEIYDDSSVRYTGASIEDFDSVWMDIFGAIEQVRSLGYRTVYIAGHSFGSNLVSSYARRAPRTVDGVVLLSPADSAALYEEWVRSTPLSTHPTDAAAVVWDAFGVRTGGRSYPIPVSSASLSKLVDSQVFKEWSHPGWRPLIQRTLIIQGAEDPISNFGNTKDLVRVTGPTTSLIRIPGAGHGFNGSEHTVSTALIEWCQSRLG